MIIKQDFGEVDGGIPTYTITAEQIKTATDANPYVINGNFSNVTSIMVTGRYFATEAAGRVDAADFKDNISLGTTYKLVTGAYSSFVSYRNVTVYADRIEIGQGYYNTTANSSYGIIETLSINLNLVMMN